MRDSPTTTGQAASDRRARSLLDVYFINASLLLCLAGAVAHSTFLLTGDARFATPFSTALICAFGVASLVQVLLAARR
jgi:hypothetical protein